MKRYFRIISMILLFSGFYACSPVTPASQEAAPTFEPTKSARGSHPLTARTGMEEIDNILEAAASGDVKLLQPLIQFTNAKCTKQDGLGGPPKCREGEAEGTEVEVLPFLGSEGSYLRSDEIENWPGIDVSGLYAIYEVSPAVTYEQYFPAGKYAIVFVGQASQPGVVLRVDGGRIVRIDSLFDQTPNALDSLVQREASNVILGPAQ